MELAKKILLISFSILLVIFSLGVCFKYYTSSQLIKDWEKETVTVPYVLYNTVYDDSQNISVNITNLIKSKNAY